MRRTLLALLLMLVTAWSYGDDWSDWSPFGPTPPPASQPTLKVFDANGKVIGPYAVYTGYNEPQYSYVGVYLSVNGSVTFARIQRQYEQLPLTLPSIRKFAWSVTSDVDYESADCSGTPVIGFRTSGPRPSVAVREGADVILYVAGGGNTSTTTHGSHLQLVGNANQCSPGTPGQTDAGNARTQGSVVLTQRYPEPLTVGY